MRRDGVFWGGILILLGVLFLLQQWGFLLDAFTWFWPFFLILLGGWIILGLYWRPSKENGGTFSIALEGAREAGIKFEHGAGRIDIGGGASGDELLNGSAGRGIGYSSSKSGDRLEAKVTAGPSFIPFIGPDSGVWHFRLNRNIPLYLNVEAGASQIKLDLSDLNVPHARLTTGASTTHITVPERGVSLLDIEGGAASIDVRIPEGVAARLRVKQGVTSLNVDVSRFPRLDSEIYQSTNYDQSPNRVELSIEAGLGSITVK